MMRNRTEGHNWERRCVKLLQRFFPFIVTARSESRSRDNKKIDLINYDEYKNGMLPFEFQCKSTASKLDYVKVLNEMPGEFPRVILHKKTKKKGKRFYEEGTYAILELNDFLNLLDGSIRIDRERGTSSESLAVKEP